MLGVRGAARSPAVGCIYDTTRNHLVLFTTRQKLRVYINRSAILFTMVLKFSVPDSSSPCLNHLLEVAHEAQSLNFTYKINNIRYTGGGPNLNRMLFTLLTILLCLFSNEDKIYAKNNNIRQLF